MARLNNTINAIADQSATNPQGQTRGLFDFSSTVPLQGGVTRRKKTEKRASEMSERGTRRIQRLKDTFKGLIPEREPIDRSQIPSSFPSGYGQPEPISVFGQDIGLSPISTGQPYTFPSSGKETYLKNRSEGPQSLLPTLPGGQLRGQNIGSLLRDIQPGGQSLLPTQPSVGTSSPELIEEYFRTQRDSPNPLTVPEFAAQQRGTQVGTPLGTSPQVGKTVELGTGQQVQVDAQGNIISGLPGTPTEPPSKIDVALESYLKDLAPSPELTTAKERLGEMKTQAALDYEKALEMGDTLGFARGEAGLTARQNAILRAGQAATVQAYTALDAQRGKISKARYEYEKGKLDEIKEAQKIEKFLPGQQGWRLDPITGEYEQVVTVPEAEKQYLTEVGGKRVLVKGKKIIATFGPVGDKKAEAAVTNDLRAAADAITEFPELADSVRRRFLEKHPKEGPLYNRYMGVEGILSY